MVDEIERPTPINLVIRTINLYKLILPMVSDCSHSNTECAL